MMRKISFRVGVFLMCMFLVLSPSVGLGEDRELEGGLGVGWAGEVEGGNYAVHARALNKYNAACWAMGVNPLTISTVNRSKLSDPNYGGDFYVYAQSFTNIIGWDDVPGWMPTYTTLTFVLYGFDNQWASEVSKSLYDSAKADFKRVLAGEDLGGGDDTPSSPVSGEPLVFTGNPHLNSWGKAVSTANYYAIRDSNKNAVASVDVTNRGGLPVVPAPVTFTISNYGSFSFDPSQYNFYMYVGYWSNNSNDVYFGIFAVPSTTLVNLVSRANGGGADVWYCNATFPSTTCYKIELRGKYSYSDGSFAVSSFYYNTGWDSYSSSSIGSDNNYSAKGMECIYTYGSGGPASPPPPDGNWPEDDTPSVSGVPAPEIPTPTAPVVTTEPSVSGPSVVWPEITINVEPTPEGLDYTELLRAINNNLNSLRSDLNQEFDSVISSLRNIYQYLQHLDSMLERHCKHIRDSIEDNVYELELWLKSLFEWLPEQLDYDADLNFDDSGIKYLLRRILNKIPGGSTSAPTTYKPNPQADEPSFFDWLLDLWHRFLIDLVSVLPDELGGLVDAFSQLTHYFPFSIPWDLFALLLLFEHEPVTPVFQIPWGYGGGEGQTQMITIDLSVWDGVMAMVRPVFLVGFCFKLALITKDLLAGFDLSKGGV